MSKQPIKQYWWEQKIQLVYSLEANNDIHHHNPQNLDPQLWQLQKKVTVKSWYLLPKLFWREKKLFCWSRKFLKKAENLQNFWDHKNNLFKQCPNVSTTSITAMGCRQCLPLKVVPLKGKHCRKPHCCIGVVDTFRLWRLNIKNQGQIFVKSK